MQAKSLPFFKGEAFAHTGRRECIFHTAIPSGKNAVISAEAVRQVEKSFYNRQREDPPTSFHFARDDSRGAGPPYNSWVFYSGDRHGASPLAMTGC